MPYPRRRRCRRRCRRRRCRRRRQFQVKFLFINLSQVKVAVNKFKLGKCCSNSEAF